VLSFGSLAFPVSLFQRDLRLLPLGLLLLMSRLSLLHFSRSHLFLGSVALPLSLLQRLFRPLSLSLFLQAALRLSLPLFSRSCLLLGNLAFPASRVLRLFRPLALGCFPLLSSLLLPLFRFVPLHALVELDQVTSCLIKHRVWINQFDSHSRSAWRHARPDGEERCEEHGPKLADGLDSEFSH
jgi:hypothetical protein